VYTWGGSDGSFDGGVAHFLDQLNDVAGGGSNCFAGHCDWRLPSTRGSDPVFPAELESIRDCSGGSPCIDLAFGPTFPSRYWSSVTWPNIPQFAGVIDFNSSSSGAFVNKSIFSYHVRAVRGGL